MAEKKKSPVDTGKVGYGRPPVSRQFGQPNGNRGGHGWKKEDTARYKLERMMKLSSNELKAVAEDPGAPLFERKLAMCINSGDWGVLSGMINQVYGKPKETVDVSQKTVLGIEVSRSEKEILDKLANG